MPYGKDSDLEMKRGNILSESLSPEEIRILWNKNDLTKHRPAPRVVMYDEIINRPSIKSVFGKSKSVILFYPNAKIGEDVIGHYVCLVKHPKGYQFYDPYGFKPDTQQKMTPQRKMLYDEDANSLVKHFLSTNEPVDYSPFKHQSLSPNVATCGRHSLSRCMLDDLTNDEYHKKMTTLKLAVGMRKRATSSPYDVLVSMLFS